MDTMVATCAHELGYAAAKEDVKRATDVLRRSWIDKARTRHFVFLNLES